MSSDEEIDRAVRKRDKVGKGELGDAVIRAIDDNAVKMYAGTVTPSATTQRSSTGGRVR